jgi:hypothetical protein
MVFEWAYKIVLGAFGSSLKEVVHWRCGSITKALTKQSHEFKTPVLPKKKKKVVICSELDAVRKGEYSLR